MHTSFFEESILLTAASPVFLLNECLRYQVWIFLALWARWKNMHKPLNHYNLQSYHNLVSINIKLKVFHLKFNNFWCHKISIIASLYKANVIFFPQWCNRNSWWCGCISINAFMDRYIVCCINWVIFIFVYISENNIYIMCNLQKRGYAFA